MVQQIQTAELSAERAESLTAGFHAHSLSAAIGCAQGVGELATVRRMLDVGGGSGVYSIAMVSKNAGTEAVVMDLPVVCDIVKRYVAFFVFLFLSTGW